VLVFVSKLNLKTYWVPRQSLASHQDESSTFWPFWDHQQVHPCTEHISGYSVSSPKMFEAPQVQEVHTRELQVPFRVLVLLSPGFCNLRHHQKWGKFPYLYVRSKVYENISNFGNVTWWPNVPVKLCIPTVHLSLKQVWELNKCRYTHTVSCRLFHR